MLNLYRDLYPLEITKLVDEVEFHFYIYDSFYADLRPGKKAPLEEDRRLWAAIQPALWDLKSAEHPAIIEAKDQKKQEVAAALQYLQDAYKRFLLSGPKEDGKRDIDLIHCGHARL